MNPSRFHALTSLHFFLRKCHVPRILGKLELFLSKFVTSLHTTFRIFKIYMICICVYIKQGIDENYFH